LTSARAHLKIVIALIPRNFSPSSVTCFSLSESSFRFELFNIPTQVVVDTAFYFLRCCVSLSFRAYEQAFPLVLPIDFDSDGNLYLFLTVTNVPSMSFALSVRLGVPDRRFVCIPI